MARARAAWLLAPLNLADAPAAARTWGLQPDGDPAPEARRGSSIRANVVDHAWAAVDWTLARAMRTARFWWIAVGYLCGLFAWYAVQVHQTKYLIEIGFAARRWRPGRSASSAFTGIVGQIALGHLSDRIGREWVWTLACVGFMLCYLRAAPGLRQHPTPALLYLMVAAQGVLGYRLALGLRRDPGRDLQGRHYGTHLRHADAWPRSAAAASAPGSPGVPLRRAPAATALAFWIAIAVSAVSAGAMWLARAAQGAGSCRTRTAWLDKPGPCRHASPGAIDPRAPILGTGSDLAKDGRLDSPRSTAAAIDRDRGALRAVQARGLGWRDIRREDFRSPGVQPAISPRSATSSRHGRGVGARCAACRSSATREESCGRSTLGASAPISGAAALPERPRGADRRGARRDPALRRESTEPARAERQRARR